MKVIRNAVTGHEFKFLRTGRDTGGERLEMEVSYPAQSNRPPMHYHPAQTEFFKVIAGAMTVFIDQQQRVLQAGEVLEIRPNTPHAMWNEGPGPTVLHWTVLPAMQSEQLFTTLCTLANEGKTDREGRPSLLQASLTMRRFAPEFRLARPPYLVQQIVFGLLAPLAYLLGYRAVKNS